MLRGGKEKVLIIQRVDRIITPDLAGSHDSGNKNEGESLVFYVAYSGISGKWTEYRLGDKRNLLDQSYQTYQNGAV